MATNDELQINTSFTNDASNNKPGRSAVDPIALDRELNALAEAENETRVRLKLIQRDDGLLRDASVQVSALSRQVINLMGGFNLRGVWLPNDYYAVNDVVDFNGAVWVCHERHNSDTVFDQGKFKRFGFSGGEDAALAAVQAGNHARAAVAAMNNAQTAKTEAQSLHDESLALNANTQMQAESTKAAALSAKASQAAAAAASQRAQNAALQAESAAQSNALGETKTIDHADNAVLTGLYVAAAGGPEVGEWVIKAVANGDEVHQTAENSSNGSVYQRTINTGTGVKTPWVSAGVKLSDLASDTGGKGVDLIAGAAKTVANIEALRAVQSTQAKTVVVTAYGGDQPGLGGGVFVAAPDDHTTADNGSTVIVGADGMRWVRVGGKRVGLSEIGVTDTLGAPETAQRISAALVYDGIQELDFDLSADYTFALSDKQALAGLGKIKTRGDVVCQLPAGVFELDDPITFAGSQSLTLAGAPLTEYALPAQTPAVAAVSIAGNRYQYNITLQLPGHALVAGDVVAINTTGRTLTAVDYDVTVAGSLHYLLRGAFVVVSVTTDSITIANMSRQSQDKFPGVAGSDYAANLLQVTGGVVLKFNTVMKCGKGGIVARGLGHKVRDIAFVSTSSTAYTGCDLFASGLARSLDLQTVAFIGFGLYGVNADGPVEMAGEGVYVTAAGSNGIRAARRASVNLPRSAAHGCGVTAGNGFFATTGGSLTVDASIAHGCRNTGFIANRGGYVYCENTVSAHNGNYADDAAGSFSDSEGKGYESEVGGTVVSSGSHALCNLSMGFYCLAGSTHTAIRAFACGSMHAHGFYALGSSELYTRYSVAASNKGRGFYAYENSRISALNTTAAGNVSGDYVAQGASTITAIGHTNSAAQFLPNINTNGANQIITSNAFEFPAKLVASKGGNLTITNGAITVTDTWHIVDTEGSAASDDLDTINGGVGGQILIIRALTSSRKIVLKNGTGNLAIGKDLNLNHLLDTAILMYENAANRWVLLAFGDNAVLG